MIAVIDIGTNTFHLIIACKRGNSIELLYKETIPVKLGEDSFPYGKIKPEAYLRAMDAFTRFQHTIEKYDVKSVKAVATESLRKAGDREAFICEVKSRFKINIQVITGDLEAELIALGVIRLLRINECVLIMDIGGGSTEFILADSDGVKWKASYPLGSTVLKNKFHIEDPMPENEIIALDAYVDSFLETLAVKAEILKPKMLVGTSGAFDTLSDLICLDKGDFWALKNLEKSKILKLVKCLTEMNNCQRLKMPGMTEFRAPLMPVAGIEIRTVLNRLGIKKIALAQTALKEGLAWAILNDYSY